MNSFTSSFFLFSPHLSSDLFCFVQLWSTNGCFLLFCFVVIIPFISTPLLIFRIKTIPHSCICFSFLLSSFFLLFLLSHFFSFVSRSLYSFHCVSIYIPTRLFMYNQSSMHFQASVKHLGFLALSMKLLDWL